MKAEDCREALHRLLKDQFRKVRRLGNVPKGMPIVTGPESRAIFTDECYYQDLAWAHYEDDTIGDVDKELHRFLQSEFPDLYEPEKE